MATDVLDDKFLTLNGAARVLGSSARTLKREVLTGKLRAVKVRSSWRITASELRAYLERQTVGGTTSRT